MLPTHKEEFNTELVIPINKSIQSIEGVERLDLFTSFAKESGIVKREELYKDGLHLNDAGYEVWLDLLLKKLNPSPAVDAESEADLRKNGAFGFPANAARLHCDDDNLRVQSWNDESDWLNIETPPTLEELNGKVVLIDFWATWCGPCVAGIPHLNELAEKHKADGLQILSFTNQSQKGIENFLKDTAMNYPIGVASDLSLEYGVTGIPHAFIIGRDGKLIWEGNPTAKILDAEIDKALNR